MFGPHNCGGIAGKLIVCTAGVTVKLWLTFGAAFQFALPACDAWIVHVPTATRVTVLTLTVHIDVVSDAKVTVRPEVAVAVSVNVPLPSAWLPGAVKLMV